MEIKNRNRKVIYTSKKETIKEVVKEAVKNDVNLSGANLSGANLYGADFSGANLSDVNLYGVIIKENQKDIIIKALNIKIKK
jgi:uncharacterized protein YjbI with pentapeptide repeats